MSNFSQNIPNVSKDEQSQDLFYALINHEEQYSLWPDHKAIPQGWTAKYGPAPKQECLSYIEKMWTDMRPLSLRMQMAGIITKK